MRTTVGTVRETTRRRVLVVEDDENIRETLLDVLRDSGFEASASVNGHEALERLKTEPPPDVIVLDLMMPVMDGWEFRTVQRSDSALSQVPVVVVSADGSAKASAIDADGFLRKPFRIADVTAAINRVVDEHDRARMAERLHEAERIAVLGTIAAGTAHEISNPLSLVVMNLESVGRELRRAREELARAHGADVGAASARLERAAEEVADASLGAGRVVSVVRRLQALAMRSKEPHEPVDVRRVVDDALGAVWPQVRGRARLVKQFEDVPLVGGSRVGLAQLFGNLLTNAIHAIPEGAPHEHEIRVSIQARDERVVVEVADTGCGIPPDVRARLFEPFATQSAGGGSGLGLALCRAIAFQHGGSIAAEDAPGRGTVLRVSLPVVTTQH